MKNNEISVICRSIVAKALKIEEGKTPQDPWDDAIFNFAKEADRMKYPENFIRKEFQYQIENLLKRIKRWKWETSWSNVMQRHHDYYVFLHRQGKLTHPHDKLQFEKAMEREIEGQVKPLADNAASPYS